MSYEDVINIINAHYGWSMDAHEPEYKGEIKEKMQAMKHLVSELQAKAEAYDDIRYAMEMQTAIGVSDEDTLIDIEHVILRLIERKESGGSDD